MMKLAISNVARKRVQIPVVREASFAPSDEVEIAVQVKQPHYVPNNLTVRSRIDSTMFTAYARRSVLEALESDEGVVTVQVGHKIRSPKTEER